MRKPYSPQRIAEVVALAALQGIEATARQTGIDKRTIRGWSVRAGKVPADAIAVPALQATMEAVRSQLAARIAGGKLRAVELATIDAIGRRILRDEARAAGQSETPHSAVAARDGFAEWIAEAPEVVDPEADVEEWVAAAQSLMGSGLLRLANAECQANPSSHGPDGSRLDPHHESGAHRHALLAWLSGRTEVPAGDVLEWAQEQTLALVKEHGGLVAWHRGHQERAAAEEAARVAEIARHARSRDAWPAHYAGLITAEQRDAWIAGGPSPIAEAQAAEARALIEQAEQWLKENAA